MIRKATHEYSSAGLETLIMQWPSKWDVSTTGKIPIARLIIKRIFKDLIIFLSLFLSFITDYKGAFLYDLTLHLRLPGFSSVFGYKFYVSNFRLIQLRLRAHANQTKHRPGKDRHSFMSNWHNINAVLYTFWINSDILSSMSARSKFQIAIFM